MSRAWIPNRRGTLHYDYECDRLHYTASASWVDGRLAEIFLAGAKLDSTADVAARDLGIAASLALQAGIDPAELRAALTRTTEGKRAGALGVALDLALDDISLEYWA